MPDVFIQKKIITKLFNIRSLSIVMAMTVITIGGGLYHFHLKALGKAFYITSEKCHECHADFYTAWKNETLHSKMFRPVQDPQDIQGDFTSDNPVLTFKKEDVEFVIGSKWEQVYARMIDGEYYPLPAKWYITTQKWVPYKVKNWRKTPISIKCNGCHTTGFNPDTYEFSEYSNGCEACHGPGSKHVYHRQSENSLTCAICHHKDSNLEKDIIVSVNSAVCGQCHTRGTEKLDIEHVQTTFNFPLNVTPGNEIGGNFKPLTIAQDKKNKYWWEIGISKNRHQEFADFSLSKHAQALTLLRERNTPERGKLKDECLQCHSSDYMRAPEGRKPTLETATQGLTCVSCHEPHGLDRHFRTVRISANRCGSCHVESMERKSSSKGRASHYPGPPSSKQCVDCHMPYIVKSGGGFYIRSHAFKIVPPTATRDYGIPNSCQNGGCHSDKSLEWAIQEFAKFYGAEDVFSHGSAKKGGE